MVYDAIIVGARCAGSSLALLLARKGYRVLLLDKASFPSDTLSSHFIHPRGLVYLQRWGVLNTLLATGCPPVREFSLDTERFTLSSTVLPLEGINFGLAPRRYILDTLLAQKAVESGAELRETFRVQDVTRNGTRVTGIKGRTTTGAPVTEKATLVIGADGLHSLIARAVEAPTYHRYPALTCTYYAYWSGMKADATSLHSRPQCVFLSFPTHEELVLISVTWPRRRFPEVRSAIESHFLKALALAPAFAAGVHQGKQEERFLGTGDTTNFFKKPYGPGWALLGDAGYHKDPLLGHGIADAFADAERLAQAIDSSYAGQQPQEEALAGYEQQRNREALPLYELTVQLATLNLTSEVQQVQEALQGNPEATQRFFAVLEGTIPAATFFAPENIRAILTGTQRTPHSSPHPHIPVSAAGAKVTF